MLSTGNALVLEVYISHSDITVIKQLIQYNKYGQEIFQPYHKCHILTYLFFTLTFDYPHCRDAHCVDKSALSVS